MITIPMADLSARNAALESELIEALTTVVRSGRYILGPEVQALEREVAALSGVKQGVGVSSGTDALLVALMALGVGPGDEVITTPFSFFASVGAIVRLGATPVFADIDPRSYNLDPGKAIEKLTSRTRAFEVVHLFGQCGDVETLRKEADRVGVSVIEDAAQAIGAARAGAPAGSLGALACLSFFPTKNLGGLGDGGMVLTGDEELADRLRLLRSHGARPKYQHQVIGGNFRLDELQAAALRVMLPRLEGWTTARRERARRYDELFNDAGLVEAERVVLPVREEGCFHVFHQYVIRVPRSRGQLRDHLTRAGIGTEVYYPLCFHLQPCLERLGYHAGDFPEAERAADEVLALPVYPELDMASLDLVVDEISRFFAG